MSWTAVDIEAGHRSELSGFEVVGVLRGTLPVVIEQAAVKCLEKQPWTLLQEFTARAIAEIGGLRDARQIAEALGLNREVFIAPVLDDFMAEGLVVRSADGGLRPTGRFAEVVSERCTARVVTKTVQAVLEPVSGVRWALRKTERARLTTCAAPSAAQASREAEFLRWVGSATGPLAGLRVDACRLETPKLGNGVRCEVVTFIDSTRQQWGWEVLDPWSGKPSQELRAACEALNIESEVQGQLERRGGSDEPPSTDLPSELARRVEELQAQLAELGRGGHKDRLERLLTSDARKRLKELIRGATSEVVLRFPWIKAAATEELLPDLHAAVRRGACVVVGYGICETEAEEDSEPRAIAAIRALRSQDGDNVATVVWLGNSHVKEAVVDRRHYMQGSFNMLSFRGDPDRKSGQIRQEVMIYIDRQEFVEDASRRIRDDFRERLMALAAQSKSGGAVDMVGWCARWQALSMFGMSANEMRRALGEFPAEVPRFDRPVSLIVQGMIAALGQDSGSLAWSLIGDWLRTRCEAAKSMSPKVRKKIAASLAEAVSRAEKVAPKAIEGWRPFVDALSK